VKRIDCERSHSSVSLRHPIEAMHSGSLAEVEVLVQNTSVSEATITHVGLMDYVANDTIFGDGLRWNSKPFTVTRPPADPICE